MPHGKMGYASGSKGSKMKKGAKGMDYGKKGKVGGLQLKATKSSKCGLGSH